MAMTLDPSINALSLAELTSPSSVTTYEPGGSTTPTNIGVNSGFKDPTVNSGFKDPTKERRPQDDPWKLVLLDSSGNFISAPAGEDIYAFAQKLAGPITPAASSMYDFREGKGRPIASGQYWNDFSVGPTPISYVRGSPLRYDVGVANHPYYEQISPAEIAMFVNNFLGDQVSLEDFGKNRS